MTYHRDTWNRRKPLLLLLMIAAVAVGGCGSPFSLTQLLDGPDGVALSVSPGGGTVVANNSVVLEARGGVPPYEYELVSGSGSVSGNVYTASVIPGIETVAVSDSVGTRVEVVFTVDAGAVGFGITPASQTVYTGETITFSPVGGTGPTFTYAITSNNSFADPMSGATYEAGPLDAGTPSAIDTITITDTSDMTTATASITVVQRDLAINNPSVTVTTGDTVEFVNVGGTGDFTYEVSTNNSGAPSMSGPTYASGTTATYTAGTTGGVTDVVTMTDAYDGRTVTATVDVVAGTFVSDVDYDVDPIVNVASLNSTGSAVTADSGVTNVGTAAGTANLHWVAYASPDTTIGGTGDSIVDSGTMAGLGAGISQPIPISGTWPLVQGDYWLLIDVYAADEIAGPENREQTATQTYVTTPVSISPSSFTVYTGQSFSLTASGEGTGFTWDFDTNASGASVGPTGATVTYTAGGTPATDTVRVTDDYDGSQALATIDVLATPLPNAVNYVIDSITVNPGGTLTGDAVDGTVDIRNATAGNGGYDIEWKLYASRGDQVLGSGDALIASGVTGFLTGSETRGVAFAGNWPAEAGDYYLIATIDAPDESDATGNTFPTAMSTPVSEPAPADVDYVVSVPPTGGARLPGDTLAESVTIANAGGEPGSADLEWSAYLSEDTIYDGSDVPVGNGTELGGLAGGDSTGALALSGTWPGSGPLWPYYIIVKLSANDDIDKSNNTAVSAGYFQQTTGYDYVVSEITNDYPVDQGGSPIRETFSVTNTGDTDGTTYDWTLSLSNDDTIGSDTPHASSTSSEPFVAAGSTVTIPNVGARWPEVTVDTQYWLVVSVTADGSESDDTNNATIQGPYTVEAPPDYHVSATTVQSADGFAGQTLDTVGPFDFTITNAGADGASPVAWEVYASLDPALDATDTLVAEGVASALAAGASSPAPISIGAGSWPAFGSRYYLIYTLSADDDQNSLNDIWNEGPFLVPERYAEGGEDNGDTGPTNNALANVSGLDATLGGGLSPNQLIRVDGTGDGAAPPPGGPTYDTYGFTIGAGTTGVATWIQWGDGADSIDMYMWDELGWEGTSWEAGLGREPVSGEYTVTGWTSPESGYVGVEFLGGFTGAYALYIRGEP